MKYILAALVLTFSMQSSAEIQGDEIQWDAEIQREQSSADTWLCIADKAAGMMLENGSWESVTVKPGDKYLIKESEEMLAMNGYVYEVYQFGKDISRSQCRDFGSEEWLVGGMLVYRCLSQRDTWPYILRQALRPQGVFPFFIY